MPLAAPVPPVSPVVVQNPFSPAAHDWLPSHRGVDLEAHPGQQVVAPRRGRVVFAGRVADRPVVSVRSRGVRFSFEPVTSTLTAGDRVLAGQSLGRIGHGGHCDDHCLHWGAKVNSVYVDPTAWLPRRSPVLKPVFTVPLPADAISGPAGTCCGSGSRDSP